MEKIYLFDTDGVLVHSEMWSVEYSRRMWLSPNTMKPFFSGIFQECIIGKADLQEVIVPYLKEWKWKWNPDKYLHAWFDFENKPDKLLIEKIQKLRKNWAKCYVATNQENYRLAYLRKNMAFETFFDGVFCSAEIGYKKPQKEFYTHIVSTLDVEPDNIVYFDDDEKNILSSKELGIKWIIYQNISDYTSFLR